MMDSNMKHDKMHWRCCWKPMLGILFWLGAFVSLVCAWYARDAVFWGYSGLGWYWNALVLGILAIPLKMKHGWCKNHGDACGGGMCGMPDHNHN